MEERRIGIRIDTNAGQVTQQTNALGESINKVEDANIANNKAVEEGAQAHKSLKAQLREANLELQRQIQLTGESSAETIAAARAVAGLRDQMEFASQIADTFNPDQQMRALGAATQIAGTGLQGVTSGMALFGDQSQDTQEQLLKVQAAMAFSDAISGLSNLGDQWQLLKAAITSNSLVVRLNTAATGAAAIVQNLFTGSVNASSKGFKILKLAIAGTGIGLLVVGLALVVANFDKIKTAMSNIGWLKDLGDAITGITNAVTDFLGLTSDAERVLDKQKEVAEKSLKQNERYLRMNEHKLSDAKKREIELNQAHFQRVIDGEISQEQSLKILRETANIDRRKAKEEADKKQEEIDKKAQEKAKEKRQKEIEDAKENQLKIFENENNFIAEQLKNEKLSIDEKRNIVLESNILSISDRQKFLLDLQALEIIQEEKHRKEIEDLNIKYDEEKAQRLADTAVKKEELDYENRVKEIELLSETELEKQTLIEKLDAEHKERLIIAKKTDAEKELEIEKAVAEGKKNIRESFTAVLEKGISVLQSFFGKNKAIQKGLVVAESAVGISKIVTSTQAANAADTAASALMGPAGIPYLATKKTINAVSAGLGIAANVGATAKALQALGGGSAPTAGNVGGGATAQVAPSVAFNNTSENQIGQSLARSQSEQAPIKVFVAESDISEAINNVKVLVDKNKV